MVRARNFVSQTTECARCWPVSAALASPLPGRHELSTPHTGTAAFGFRFRLEVVGRVLAVIERPPFADEPIVDAFAAGVAHGEQPVVPITGVARRIRLALLEGTLSAIPRRSGRTATPV